jgi:hypothetical protein
MYKIVVEKRQATQHGCLPSLLGDGDKRIEIKEKIFSSGLRTIKPNKPTKKGPLSPQFKQSAGATPL